MKNDVDVYSTGICSMSICVPKKMSIETIEELAPITGINTSWKVSKDKTFADGKLTNPCICEDDEDRLHYLLYC